MDMPHPAVIASGIKIQGSNVIASYQPTEEELNGTAIVTMASGDEAGRNALALMQSLRDVGTRVPSLVVVLMMGGTGSSECIARGDTACSSSKSTADTVSSIYVEAFKQLEVELLVMNPLDETEFTQQVAGGRQSGWGMALNKLRVFGLVQFRKLLWMDADTLVLQNVDHLLAQPEFTAAFTNDCNNRNAAYKISGGMWVLVPSTARVEQIDHIVKSGELGEGQEWRLGDMEVVLYMFSTFTRASREDGYWPSSYDTRQGRTPGVELTDPRYAAGGEKAGVPAGPLPEAVEQAKREGKSMWYPLDVRYDHLAQECVLLPERDLGLPEDAAAELGLTAAAHGRPWGSGPDDMAAPLPVVAARAAGNDAWRPTKTHLGYTGGFISLHFSCMSTAANKPSWYRSEQELVDAAAKINVCARRNMMLWYSKYLRALQGKRWFSSSADAAPKISDPATTFLQLV